jgi:hypothetical protein
MPKRLLVGFSVLGVFAAGLAVGALMLRPREAEESRRSLQLHPKTTSVTSVQPLLSSVLTDGRSWSLRDDSLHGLCLIIDTTDFGCDVGPSPRSNQAFPRRAVEANGFPTPQSGVLVYGVLPSGASKVVLVGAGGSVIPADLVVEPTSGMWAAPIEPGANPKAVVYVAEDGSEVARFGAG